MFKFKNNNRTIACLLLSVLSFVCFMVAGLSIGVNAKADTVSYSIGNDGIYVTESFDNAVSYKTKTDATVLPDSTETYGKTLSKMLTVKLSESIDINKDTSEWDGFLIHLSFSARFRFYMWLGSIENVDGQEKITVSRNYNSKTQRYEKFLDQTGKDLSVEEKGVYTNSGYCLSTGALSGTWVYNFSDIIVNPKQTIEELYFGLRVNAKDHFGQGFEINSISVYKAGETAADYKVKTLFNAKNLTVTNDPTDTTAGLNVADPQKGAVVHTAKSLANNTGSFIDSTLYAKENEIGNSNVVVTVPSGTVTVNYLNEDGQSIKDSVEAVYLKGQTYTVETPNIGEYHFKEADKALTGTVTSDITINVVYAIAGVSVTVNYVDEQGNVISAQTSRSYYSGANYTVVTPEFLGYEFVSASGELTGTINSDITITLTYKKVDTFVVTVKYVDEEGKGLIADKTQEYNDGATYQIVPEDIDHYSYKQADKPLTGTITEAMEIVLTYGIDMSNPPRTHTDVNYAVADEGLHITDDLVGGVVFKTKDVFSPIADSATTYGKTILATFKINFTETIDAVEEWDGLLIRIKNNSAKNVKFNAFLYSNGTLGRNYISSDKRDEVFIDKNGANLGNTQLGINYASAYPTISAYADGTWNYKFSDLKTATAKEMTDVSAFILGLRVTTNEFAGCNIVIGSIAAYKEDASSNTGYTVKTLFNSKDLVVSDEEGYTKADVNFADPDLGRVITSEVAPINNTGLFVDDQYYSTLHSAILSTIKLELQGCTVTCNYVDEYGDHIATPTSINVAAGGTYTVSAKEIAGYIYSSADKPLSGIVNEDLTINILYELEKFTLTVKFVDEQGNKVKDDVTITVKYGDYVTIDETVDEFKVDGYKHKSVDGTAKFTVYSSEVRTVTCEVLPVTQEQKGCKGGIFSSIFCSVVPCIVAFAAVLLKKAKRGDK